MKTQLKGLVLLLACFAIFLVSCDKDDTPPKSKTELITQGSWKFKAATANGTDISNQNPPFEPCKKDNILSFAVNGTGVMSEGATKCNAADPDTVPFTWSLLNNETTLHLTATIFAGSNSDFTLESVSETELVVSQGYTPIAGPTYLIKVTFQH
jgi:hypothetical protein